MANMLAVVMQRLIPNAAAVICIKLCPATRAPPQPWSLLGLFTHAPVCCLQMTAAFVGTQQVLATLALCALVCNLRVAGGHTWARWRQLACLTAQQARVIQLCLMCLVNRYLHITQFTVAGLSSHS
jgi:hypothetical protein